MAAKPVSVLRRQLRRLGYDVGRFPSHESLGSHLLQLFARFEINCVLDVGAHFGEFAGLLRSIGYRGHIVSFEPIQESFDVLCQAAEGDPRWAVRRLALGATDEKREANVLQDTQLASLLVPKAEMQLRFGADAAVRRTEFVRVVRLDSVFGECIANIDDPRVFLKMDTQGFDPEVLAGATNSLERIRALQTEVATIPLYEGAGNLSEAADRLRALGFDLTGVFPVSRDSDLRLLDVDCVAVKRDLCAEVEVGA